MAFQRFSHACAGFVWLMWLHKQEMHIFRYSFKYQRATIDPEPNISPAARGDVILGSLRGSLWEHFGVTLEHGWVALDRTSKTFVWSLAFRKQTVGGFVRSIICTFTRPCAKSEIGFASRFPPRRLGAKEELRLDFGASKFESGVCDLPPKGSPKKS